MTGEVKKDVDLLVIGAGSGGYVAAIRAAQLGKKVVLVDKAELGGVCLNRGCIPSKALISASERIKHIKHADAMGIRVSGDVQVEMPEVVKWKNGIVNKLTNGIRTLLEGSGVEVISGEAYLTASHTAKINVENEEHIYSYKDLILAIGSLPVELKSMPFDKKRVISSTEALMLQEVPNHLVVVGGGYIGLELGTAYAKFGAKVTILEGSDTILSGTDPILTKTVKSHLKKLGITVITNALVQGGENTGDEVNVYVQVDGQEETIQGDYCLVSIGRKPNTGRIGLENIGVKLDDRGFIKINNKCQTNVDHVYAIGDCAGGDLLAHKASYEGKIAAEVISGQNSEIDFQAMPFVIFSDPEVAYTGLTEKEAEEKGYKTITSRFPFQANARALSVSDADGFVQVVAEKKTKMVLGVQMVGPEVSSLIAEAVFAIEAGATAEDISLTIHAHPTLPEPLMEASEGIMGHAIHMSNKSK
ncbi:dihydrolipoyl dehydrogenase [Halobacillus amylolyticus]|uniref:Dihydrolipoyl dehydrogenase n=1 Tax=Halobacillus amylolyticus TaxID=2932259 RepID=A0ABY4HHU0_9BACI|nr:dihydrolipoyl dehydrogenase [Halobacillus amylolyticus]UOR14146.1 dihydrolipoyl dehydrogenase [Halobacillus amylolyticus]